MEHHHFVARKIIELNVSQRVAVEIAVTRTRAAEQLLRLSLAVQILDNERITVNTHSQRHIIGSGKLT